MNRIRLEAGCNEIGIIYDGVEDAPSVVAMLHAAADSPPSVRMPYISPGFFGDASGVEQFSTINEWFSTEKFPVQLSFDAGDLKVQLFGCRFSSKTESIMGTATSVGTMAPEVAIVSGDTADVAHRTEPLRLREMTSSIDTLLQWSGIRSTSFEYQRTKEGRVKSFAIRATTVEPVEWQSREAKLSVESYWKGTPGSALSGKGLEGKHSASIESSTWLTSRFEEPRTVREHLTQQRGFVALLVLIYGAPIRFREHLTSDEPFGARSHLVYAHTWREHHQELKNTNLYEQPVFRMTDIGVDGLNRWSGKDGRWDRAINPLLGLLQRDRFVVEDIAIAAMISLEASGEILGKVEGEEVTYRKGRPITATRPYRCLSNLMLDWETMPFDQERLAKAMANNYNDIKHFDRGEFPEPEVTHALGNFALLVARLVVLNVASMEAVEAHLKAGPQNLHRAIELLKGLEIDEQGTASFKDDGLDP